MKAGTHVLGAENNDGSSLNTGDVSTYDQENLGIRNRRKVFILQPAGGSLSIVAPSQSSDLVTMDVDDLVAVEPWDTMSSRIAEGEFIAFILECPMRSFDPALHGRFPPEVYGTSRAGEAGDLIRKESTQVLRCLSVARVASLQGASWLMQIINPHYERPSPGHFTEFAALMGVAGLSLDRASVEFTSS